MAASRVSMKRSLSSWSKKYSNMVQNRDRCPMKTTLIFITCMNFLNVCIIFVLKMSIQQRKHNIGWFSFNFCAIGADGKILDHFLVTCFNHWKERKLWYWQDLCKNIQAITSCNFTKERKNLINVGTLYAVIELKQGENLS